MIQYHVSLQNVACRAINNNNSTAVDFEYNTACSHGPHLADGQNSIECVLWGHYGNSGFLVKLNREHSEKMTAVFKQASKIDQSGSEY